MGFIKLVVIQKTIVLISIISSGLQGNSFGIKINLICAFI